MKRYKLTILALLSVVTMSNAQSWRTGVTGGAAFNHFSIDKQYMQDAHYGNQWGGTAGLMGQYDFSEWLGIRMDLNWIQKNHHYYRTGNLSGTDYRVCNSYVQIPLMASASFGGTRLRGFVNIGVYGGWLVGRRRVGTMTSTYGILFGDYSQTVKIDERGINRNQDKRFEFGFAGGLGADYRINEHWGVQLEARCYYGITNTIKSSSVLADYRYNTTVAVQCGIYYKF